MNTANLEQVVAFIRDAADERACDVVAEMLKTRRRTLADAAAAAISEGDLVRMQNLRPAYLNNLTGTVESVIRKSGRARSHAAVLLDDLSSDDLRRLGHENKGRIDPGTSRILLDGIPLQCLRQITLPPAG